MEPNQVPFAVAINRLITGIYERVSYRVENTSYYRYHEGKLQYFNRKRDFRDDEEDIRIRKEIDAHTGELLYDVTNIS